MKLSQKAFAAYNPNPNDAADSARFLTEFYDKEPDYHYEKFEVDSETPFAKQFLLILKTLQTWANEHNPHAVPSGFLTFDSFIEKYRTKKFGDSITTASYVQAKQQLEHIYYLLIHGNKTQSFKINLINELLKRTQDDVCGPGVFTSIQELYLEMLQEKGITFWLAEARTTLITKIAGEIHAAARKNNLFYNVHLLAYALRLAQENSLNPLSSNQIQVNDAHNGEAREIIKARELVGRFHSEYTLEFTVHVLVARFMEELKILLHPHFTPNSKQTKLSVDVYNELYKQIGSLFDHLKIGEDENTIPLTLVFKELDDEQETEIDTQTICLEREEYSKIEAYLRAYILRFLFRENYLHDQNDYFKNSIYVDSKSVTHKITKKETRRDENGESYEVIAKNPDGSPITEIVTTTTTKTTYFVPISFNPFWSWIELANGNIIPITDLDQLSDSDEDNAKDIKTYGASAISPEVANHFRSLPTRKKTEFLISLSSPQIKPIFTLIVNYLDQNELKLFTDEIWNAISVKDGILKSPVWQSVKSYTKIRDTLYQHHILPYFTKGSLVDVDKKDRQKRSLLYWAIALEQTIKTIQILNECGAPWTLSSNETEQAPLYVAAAMGRQDVFEFLATNENTRTLLTNSSNSNSSHFLGAVIYGQLALVEFFLSQGISINTSINYSNPNGEIKKLSYSEIAIENRQFELASFLVEKHQCYLSPAFFHDLHKKNDAEFSSFIIEYVKKTKSQFNRSHIQFAIIENNIQLLTCYLDHFYDQIRDDVSGMNQEHLFSFAVQWNKPQIVKLFCDRNLDCLIENSYGYTALDEALNNHDDDIVTTIVEKKKANDEIILFNSKNSELLLISLTIKNRCDLISLFLDERYSKKVSIESINKTLRLALVRKNFDIAEALFAKGGRLYIPMSDSYEAFALYLSKDPNKKDILIRLLTERQDHVTSKLLLEAMSYRNIEIVDYILENVPNIVSRMKPANEFLTPILDVFFDRTLELSHEHEEILKKLFHHKVYLSEKVIQIILERHYFSLIPDLVKAYPYLLKKPIKGPSFLMQLLNSGATSQALDLIRNDSNIDLNYRADELPGAKTALDIALEKKQTEVIEELLSKGAQIYASSIRLLLEKDAPRFIDRCNRNLLKPTDNSAYEIVFNLVMESDNKDALSALLKQSPPSQYGLSYQQALKKIKFPDQKEVLWKTYHDKVPKEPFKDKLLAYTTERKNDSREFKTDLINLSQYFSQPFTLFGKKRNISKADKIAAAEAIAAFLNNENPSLADWEALQTRYKDALTNGKLGDIIQELPFASFSR